MTNKDSSKPSVAAEVAAKATPRPWAFTGDEDGDFVIWGPAPNDKFIGNVGASSFAPIDTTGTIAFDIDKANAALIVTAVNSYESSQATIRQLTEALRGLLAKNTAGKGAFRWFVNQTPAQDTETIRKAEAVLAEVKR